VPGCAGDTHDMYFWGFPFYRSAFLGIPLYSPALLGISSLHPTLRGIPLYRPLDGKRSLSNDSTVIENLTFGAGVTKKI